MTYVRLDDMMPEHPKIAVLSDKAFRVHVRGICYCQRSLSDGFIPKVIASEWGKRAIADLVGGDIWYDRGESYEIRDYLDWNDPKEVIRERLRKDSARKSAKNPSRFPSDADDATDAAVKNKERPPDPLWDALVAWYGSSPGGGSERGAWNAALKTFRDADPPVRPDEVRLLCSEAKRQWTKPFKPTAVAANLSALRASIRPVVTALDLSPAIGSEEWQSAQDAEYEAMKNREALG